MIRGLRPYPAYKDCAAWLGKLPVHWDLQRIKRIAAINPSRSEASEQSSYDACVTFLPMERVGTDGRIDSRDQRPVSELGNGFTYFRRSDVLVAKITPCFENGKGACVDTLPSEIGFGSTEFHVLCATKTVLPHFLYRVTALSEFRRQGADAMTGAAGQQRVPQSFIGNFRTPVPSLPEQAAIIRFLDYIDRRIRHYIRAKQKLVALLNEQKQAIVQRAVTRGLDPDVRLKPSGVEWLGDVPENWQILPMKRGCELIRDGTHLPPPRVPSGIPLLSVRNIVNEELVRRADDSFILESDYAALSRSLEPRKGDVLLAIVGATLGKVAIVGDMGRFQIQRSLALLRPKEQTLIGEFLAQYLRSSNFQSALWQTVAFSAQPGIYLNTISNFPFVCPPKNEQSKIVSYLRKTLGPLVDAISVNSRQIELVREHRVRLITDVVTGKLDVREAAAQLPEEPAEAEPVEEMGPLDEPENAELEAAAERADA